MTLLDDTEWAAWSDHEIARAAGVSQPLVSGLRAKSITVISEEDSADEDRLRTYTTKHGTQAVMKTANIGAKKDASTERAAEPIETAPSSLPRDALLNHFLSRKPASNETIIRSKVNRAIKCNTLRWTLLAPYRCCQLLSAHWVLQLNRKDKEKCQFIMLVKPDTSVSHRS